MKTIIHTIIETIFILFLSMILYSCCGYHSCSVYTEKEKSIKNYMNGQNTYTEKQTIEYIVIGY